MQCGAGICLQCVVGMTEAAQRMHQYSFAAGTGNLKCPLCNASGRDVEDGGNFYFGLVVKNGLVKARDGAFIACLEGADDFRVTEEAVVEILERADGRSVPNGGDEYAERALVDFYGIFNMDRLGQIRCLYHLYHIPLWAGWVETLNRSWSKWFNSWEYLPQMLHVCNIWIFAYICVYSSPMEPMGTGSSWILL